jgi:hypothetical protein
VLCNRLVTALAPIGGSHVHRRATRSCVARMLLGKWNHLHIVEVAAKRNLAVSATDKTSSQPAAVRNAFIKKPGCLILLPGQPRYCAGFGGYEKKRVSPGSDCTIGLFSADMVTWHPVAHSLQHSNASCTSCKGACSLIDPTTAVGNPG